MLADYFPDLQLQNCRFEVALIKSQMDKDTKNDSRDRLKRRQLWWKKHGKRNDDPILKNENKKTAQTKNSVNKSSKRFILFIGNLNFSTTKEDISKHFAKCDNNLQVRLLTKKDGSPRGCAFVETFSFPDYQKMLRYHHTILKDRKINVEVTAGGGGNSETRKNKIKLENDKVREKLRKTQSEISGRNADAKE